MVFPQINLLKNGKSSYSIVLPVKATKFEKQAAAILQDYFERVTHYTLPIVSESSKAKHKSYLISIGETHISKSTSIDLPSEAFSIKAEGQSLIFRGMGKGIIYGVYGFIEEVLDCRKWYANENAVCPIKEDITISQQYDRYEQPAFKYREVYFPVEGDEEYVNWHRIHLLDDLWGLWGHTFNFLVPPAKYFKTHPEYYSFFNGRRHNNQLCLSNTSVLEIAIETIGEAIEDNPYATFWSISPNDDPSYCECDNCKKLDEFEGGPQGSLIYFVNKIAERFPDQHFTTLAYTYTAQPTKNLKPLKNVTIFLSNIDADRTLPITLEPSAKSFRAQLEGWMQKTDNLFIWDYYTQFTNYLAPFPNLFTFQPNLAYYQEKGVTGVFAQGSGETYAELAEIKSYLLAKLLWNPSLKVDSLIDDFLKGYYGNASKHVKNYIQSIHKDVQHETLSIYGNPINDHSGYLSLKNMDAYSSIMDDAEKAVEGNIMLEKRIERLRMSHEYTFLQQSRFYGIELHGIFHQNDDEAWEVNDRLKSRIKNFVANCNQSGVAELAEGGLSPDEYQVEWDSIINLGVKNNIALDATIFDTKSPFETSFPAKGWRTLVDGNPGYNDYSYNWLCFYDKPMGFSLDLKAVKKVNRISLNFLVDPRHWIFGPRTVNVKVSADGVTYHDIGTVTLPEAEERYQIDRANISFINTMSSIRFIKVLATPLESLPKFRYHRTKKPMIACDEIWVE